MKVFNMKLSFFIFFCICQSTLSLEEVKATNVCHQCYGENGLCSNENDQGHFTTCNLDEQHNAYCASVTQVGNGGENSYYKGCAADYTDEDIVSLLVIHQAYLKALLANLNFSDQCMLLLL